MRDFWRPPMLNRRFLFKTWCLVWGIRLGLWLLPFGWMRGIMEKLAQSSDETNRPRWPAPKQISWAVTVTSQYIPQATCLTQAMVTRILLGQYGHQAVLRIGVTRGEEGDFQAHAWVESNGVVVIGGDEAQLAQKYVTFPVLGGERE